MQSQWSHAASCEGARGAWGVHPWSSLANCRLLYLELPPYLKSLGYLHMVCYNELTCYFGEGRV